MSRKRKEPVQSKITEATVTTQVDISKLNQTHAGMKGPRSIEEIMGYGTKYKTANFSEYQEQIRAYTNVDLHDHAYELGIVPVDPKELLYDRLEKHFLSQQTRNIFQVIPGNMSEEAVARQKRFMQNMI